MNFGLKQQDIQVIQNTFKQFPEVKSAVVFGSRAMGNFKQGSDVDLALKGNIDHTCLNRIKDILQEELTLPYFFDVIIYNETEDQALKNHIDQYGQIIYSSPK